MVWRIRVLPDAAATDCCRKSGHGCNGERARRKIFCYKGLQSRYERDHGGEEIGGMDEL